MFETAAIPGGMNGQRIRAMGMGVAGQALVAACAIAIPLLSPAVLPKPQALLALVEAPMLTRTEQRVPNTPRNAVRDVPRQITDTGVSAPRTVPDEVIAIQDPPPPAGLNSDPSGRTVDNLSDFMRRIERSAALTPAAPPVAAPVVEKAPAPAPAAAEPRRYKVGGRIVAAVPIRRVEPQYPRLAIQTRVSGKVELEAVIGTDGRIHGLRALSGPPLLVPAAMEAVRQWVYKPYMLNDDPVEVEQTIIVTFNLK